jgi:hypothetical protein
MIRASAAVYGANPDGLVRIAMAESTMNPNAVNRDDSNWRAGKPSKGLFQFIETTFNDFSAKAFAAKPDAWAGVNRAWLDPHAQALTAAWAITHGQGSHWATIGSYGDGGHFKANKPTPIIVGDKQPEEVRVTPTRGANKGKYSGGSTTVVNSTINLGHLIADEAGIEMFTEKIGEQIRKDVRTARQSKQHKDR